ncbi:MAG: hypothetical protein U1D70_19485 [Methylobacter sp.]|nr:hypothetical protein [Methylobacter sp.]
MGLINGSGLIELASHYRIIWIQGRFGGGKTALAYQLAMELVRLGRVKYIISNVKDVVSDVPDDVKLDEHDRLNTAIIADEGGVFLRYGRDVEEYLTMMRKLNIILIIPSVMPPSMRVRFFSVRRVMNLAVIGLPIWIYRWKLSYGGEVEKENFAWVDYKDIFGLYDTLGAPVDDGGIGAWLDSAKKEFRRNRGYKEDRGALEGGTLESGALFDAAESFSALTEDLSGQFNQRAFKR